MNPPSPPLAKVISFPPIEERCPQGATSEIRVAEHERRLIHHLRLMSPGYRKTLLLIAQRFCTAKPYPY